MARWNQFCFSPDETLTEEGGEDDVGHRPTAPDKVGPVRRKPEGPGRFGPIPAGFGLPAPRVRSSPNPLILNQTGVAK